MFSSSDKNENKDTEQKTLPDPVHGFILKAFEDNATDIHIDSFENQTVIRHRVDGIIYEQQTLSEEQSRRLINEIKVTAGIGIEKSITPQEGHIEFWHNGVRRYIRATVMPTGHVESAHLRIISEPYENWDINNLGFQKDDEQKVMKALESTSGLILISGQTGTGKTTTMYTLASMLDLKSSVGVSMEDPVEFNLPGLRQLQVDYEHGFSMSDGLKVLLRADPDVIVVAEIRDKASAITAAKAALAGRLVIATLHSKNAAHAVEAMRYLSVPNYILANVLHMVIGQRLLRTLCEHCAKVRKIKKQEKAVFKRNRIKPPKKIKTAVGCQHCGSKGYKGLTGAFETVQLTEEDENAILSEFSAHELEDYFYKKGMRSMLNDGLQKVIDGKTSFEEITRVFWSVF